MIRLTRFNQVPLVVNAELIEHIEMTPDTVISLTNGQKFMVRESSDEVVERVIQYRRLILSAMPAHGGSGLRPSDGTLLFESPLRLSSHGQ